MPKNVNQQSILIVEDDETLQQTLTYNLEQEGYKITAAFDGQTGLELARSQKPDLIVLDIMLPGLDGLSVCRIIRREMDVPIIMLTARSSEVDKIIGLDSGADDYITKPFSMEELLFRIEAIFRRTKGSRGLEKDTWEIGSFTFDVKKQILTGNGVEQKLTTKESELLKLLCNNMNQVLERNFALKAIWIDDNYFNARSMDVYITKLRKYLKADPGVQIINVHGKGYKLVLDEN